MDSIQKAYIYGGKWRTASSKFWFSVNTIYVDWNWREPHAYRHAVLLNVNNKKLGICCSLQACIS